MSALPLAGVDSYRAPAPLRECIAVRDMTDCLIEAYDCVARLAYQKFVARGSHAGGELDDWLKAEHELLDKLSVHIEDSGEFIHALVSIPGAHASQVKIGIESRWLVIVSHRECDGDAAQAQEDDEKVAEFSRAAHSGAQTERISAGAFALCPELHARRQPLDVRTLPAVGEVVEQRPQLFSIIELPAEVDPTHAVAVLADGLLGLRVPKKIV
jgi:HSP20 family molecular chaperone IbpA